MKITRPAWLEINLDQVKKNMQEIQRHLKEGTEVISIVKADAYSFGAIEIAKTMKECGVTHFAVASGNEALALRRALPRVDILVLGYTPEEVSDMMIDNSIDMAMYRMDVAEKLNALAARLGKKAGVHIAIDSGMNRIGFKPTEESIDFIEKIVQMDHIEVKGMFTHFALADESREFTIKQYERFDWVYQELRKRGITLNRHVANSHALMNFREFDLESKRIKEAIEENIDLEKAQLKADLEPTNLLKTQIIQRQGDLIGLLESGQDPEAVQALKEEIQDKKEILNRRRRRLNLEEIR